MVMGRDLPQTPWLYASNPCSRSVSYPCQDDRRRIRAWKSERNGWTSVLSCYHSPTPCLRNIPALPKPSSWSSGVAYRSRSRRGVPGCTWYSLTRSTYISSSWRWHGYIPCSYPHWHQPSHGQTHRTFRRRRLELHILLHVRRRTRSNARSSP